MIKRRAFIAASLASAAAAALPRQGFAAAPAQKLFDTHCHFYTNDPAKYPFNPTGARYGAERMSFLVSEMEAAAKAANKPMVDLKPFLEHMVHTFGADHLCWGSDYGNVEVDDVVYVQRMRDAAAGLSAKDRSAFFYDTGRVVFVPGGRGAARA